MALKIFNSIISPLNSIVNISTCISILVLIVLRNGLPKRMDDELSKFSSFISIM